jgi:diaminopimelate decarboxylase
LNSFKYIDGTLHCEEVAIEDIASKYGTPSYIYSEREIRNNAKAYLSSLKKPGIICFSVKALSNIHILKILANEGCGFDVVSAGELQRCFEAGISGEKIIFSGVGKSEQEIALAISSDIYSINAESVSEINRISKVAGEIGKVAPLGIRINPDISIASHEYIQTGKKDDKFGIDLRDALTVIKKVLNLPNLELKGIACHIGSQISDLDFFKKAAASMLEILNETDALNINLSFIDMGGGGGITYIDEKHLDPKEIIEQIEKVLHERSELLVLEPGRSIVGNAGALVTRIEYLKSSFAIVDAGMNDLIRPALYKAKHKVVDVNLSSAKKKSLKVVGPICESGDYLSQETELNSVEGDLIAVLGAGAYGSVMSSNYNSRARAPEILVNGNEFRLIKRRESVADLLSLETSL